VVRVVAGGDGASNGGTRETAALAAKLPPPNNGTLGAVQPPRRIKEDLRGVDGAQGMDKVLLLVLLAVQECIG